MTVADPYEAVKPGQTIQFSARTLNGYSKAGQDYSRRKMNENATSNRGPGVPQPTSVYNGLAAALDSFAVVQTNSSSIQVDPAALPLEAASAPVFNALAPLADGRPFFITREPIPVGCIGEVVTNGPAVAWVNVTDAAHAFADVTPGVTGYLTSSAGSGAPILYKPSGTGLKMCEVFLPTGRGSAFDTADISSVNLLSSALNTAVEIASLEFESSGTFFAHATANASLHLASNNIISSGSVGMFLAYDTSADPKSPQSLFARAAGVNTAGPFNGAFAAANGYVNAVAGHFLKLYAIRNSDGSVTWNEATILGGIGSLGAHRI